MSREYIINEAQTLRGEDSIDQDNQYISNKNIYENHTAGNGWMVSRVTAGKSR